MSLSLTPNIFDENGLDAKDQKDIGAAFDILGMTVWANRPMTDPASWQRLDNYAIQIANACRRMRIDLQISSGIKPRNTKEKDNVDA